MRTTGQIGLALVAIIALVAGVTYLSQYGPSSGPTAGVVPPESQKDKPAEPGEYFGFATARIEWTHPSEGDFESGSRGFHDFYFRNLSEKTTLLGIDFKNCKCEDAEAMVLEEAQLPNFRRWSDTRCATILAGLQQGVLACVSLMGWEELAVPTIFGLNMKFEPLDQQSKKGIPVPGKGGGLVRVRWKGKKDLYGPFLVKVRLWAEPEGKPGLHAYMDLEVPIGYVAPIALSANQVNLETFNANDEKNAAVVVSSSTEGKFDLYVTPVAPSPLVDWKIVDLNHDEIAEYQKVTGNEKRMLSAKRILITVHERLSDSQRMDLGPFYRKFFVSTDKEEPEQLSFIIGGEIRGELVVGSPEDRGRVDLKSFKARSGISKTVTILAQQPSMELNTKDIRIFPENLQAHMNVRLEKAKPVGEEHRNRWHLHVVLNAGFPAGKLPEGSAVFLEIAGSNPPRHIRIPVNGMAYQ